MRWFNRLTNALVNEGGVALHDPVTVIHSLQRLPHSQEPARHPGDRGWY